MRRLTRLGLAAGVTVLAAACGGGSGTSSSTSSPEAPLPNVQSIVVDAGPTGDSGNAAFTSVTVCVPGTSTCQTIDGILVDTGSSGLRIFGSVLNVPLPALHDPSGLTLGECGQFQDGYLWGPLASADVKIAGEQASSLPVQIAGAPGFVGVPASCANAGLVSENSVQDFGANGVLGVGPFLQDCGPACAFGTVDPPLYYACSGSGCQATAVALGQQVANPVSRFASDNNGVLVDLPAVPSSGAFTVTGSLIFGIGTRSNNAVGSARVFAIDDFGDIATVFQGRTYANSIIDSGSNATYFLDAATTGLPLCADTADFYCPATASDLTATILGTTGTSRDETFRIENADTLFRRSNASALVDLGGPLSDSFDWGLPFFYGRRVFTAIERQVTPAGVGPYFAY